MRSPISWVGEMFGGWDVSRGALWVNFGGRLRSFFKGNHFYNSPAMRDTEVTLDLARALYRNDHADYLLGAGFVKPAIDLEVEYMGLPNVVTGDNATDALLNECIQDYWAGSLQQAWRDCFRDSAVCVRFYQPRFDNPLHSIADREHGSLEVLPVEDVHLEYDPVDKNFIIQATVEHEVEIDERSLEDIAAGKAPMMKVHRMTEVITTSEYRFFDRTLGEEIVGFRTANALGFVPVWKFYNEYAADLGGGQSDIESVEPFIRAFHDVLKQSLDAHKAHSTPKAMFNVKSVEGFIANNWPGVIDPETNKIIPNATITWEGKEILFMDPDEKGGFIEAKSVLGDSKTLLSFLLECIAIASQTPKWALMENDTAQRTAASVEPFKKKIARKRIGAEADLKMILKMALVANGKTPNSPTLHWPAISIEDFVSKGQAVQQIVLALDVATANGWMATETAVRILTSIFPEMHEVDAEMRLAKKNDNLGIGQAPAPASATQALPPPTPTNGKTQANGTNGKVPSDRVLVTTTPSRS
jgi:hypothetical protein